jgi:hypothetical protein
MKKIILAAVAVFGFAFTANAQDDDKSSGSATSNGTWFVEANTGFGESSTSNTAFALRSVDGNTAWAVGAEAGYFVMDDLAVKAGLGYSDRGVDGIDGTFNWKVGGKYYIASQFPVGLDINGASGNSVSPLWVGIQAGYAWFVADNVSIEPGLRYGLGLNEDAGDGDFNVFGINIGFNIFL